MPICFAGCLSPGPRKNDLTIYWALGPFVRSFTLLVDPGDIYPPHPQQGEEEGEKEGKEDFFPQVASEWRQNKEDEEGGLLRD
jgi:hypothetical protein